MQVRVLPGEPDYTHYTREALMAVNRVFDFALATPQVARLAAIAGFVNLTQEFVRPKNGYFEKRAMLAVKP